MSGGSFATSSLTPGIGCDWPERFVAVDLTRDAVKEAPPYDRAEHADRQWEAAYYERLGWPGYWLTATQARRIKRAQQYLAKHSFGVGGD